MSIVGKTIYNISGGLAEKGKWKYHQGKSNFYLPFKLFLLDFPEKFE